MHQHRGIRVVAGKILQGCGLEALMNNTAGLPDQHVGTGYPLDIVTQVAVRRPEDFFTLGMQVSDHVYSDARGHHPVGAGLHLCTGVGVYNHGALRMRVAERDEFIRRAA